MRSRVLLLALALMAALLAGCSGEGGTPPSQEVVLTSDLPDEIRSEDEAEPEAAKPRAKGHIKGYVLTEKVEPIEGALVKLPGLDKEVRTDREGAFAFVDLHAGPHYIRFNATGFYGASADVDVEAGAFTELEVYLTRVPPPTPYHTTYPFRGYADVSDQPYGLRGLFCSGCQVPVYLDMHPEMLVFEAVSSMDVEFDLEVNDGVSCCGSVARHTGTNPMRFEIRGDQLPINHTTYDVQVYPVSLVPQAAVDFDFYVTAFYHEAPPQGWSVVGGSS